MALTRLSAALVRLASGGTLQEAWDTLRGNQVNVLDFMTKADRANCVKYEGTTDVSYAFEAAFATGSKIVNVPPGLYYAKDVTMPNKTKLVGQWAYKPYNMLSDASFDKDGTMIRKVAGADNLFLWGSGCSANNIMFDGVDRKSSAIMSKTGGKISVGFYKCGFYRWARVGNKNGGYLGCSMQFCNINQNNVGLYNTVDGNHVCLTINANKSDGVRLEKGADSNTFTNCRNEWNEGNNWNFYGCVSIQVVNEICDRAFAYGFRISNSNVQLVNVDVRRNAKSASSAATSAHFFIENSIVKMIGVKTTVGVDDTGGNVVDKSPAYVFRMEGPSKGELTLIGCKMTGSTTGLISGTARPAKMLVSSCEGWPDYCNYGLYRKNQGRQYKDYQTASGKANETPLTLSFSTVDDTARSAVFHDDESDVARASTYAVGTYSSDIMRVELMWRNTTSGGSNGAVVWLLFKREGGSATVSIMSIDCKSNVVGEADVNTDAVEGQVYTVGVSATSADASTFDLTFKVKSGNTSGFQVRGYLM